MSSDRIKRSHYVEWAQSRIKTPKTPALLTKQAMRGRYVRYSWRTNSWKFQDAVTMQWRPITANLAACLEAAGYEVQPIQLAFDFIDATQGE